MVRFMSSAPRVVFGLRREAKNRWERRVALTRINYLIQSSRARRATAERIWRESLRPALLKASLSRRKVPASWSHYPGRSQNS
jgi:hypothetical protein